MKEGEKSPHRYQLLADALGYSVNRLETEAEISKTAIGKAIRRDSKVTADIADKIVLKFPHVSKRWLITGEGEMFLQEGAVAEPGTPYATAGTRIARGVKDILAAFFSAGDDIDTAQKLAEAQKLQEQVERMQALIAAAEAKKKEKE